MAFVREQTIFSCVQLRSPDYGRTDSIRVSVLCLWKAHSAVCCPQLVGTLLGICLPTGQHAYGSIPIRRLFLTVGADSCSCLCVYHSLHHERKFQQTKTSLLEHSLRCHSSSGLRPLPGPPGVPRGPTRELNLPRPGVPVTPGKSHGNEYLRDSHCCSMTKPVIDTKCHETKAVSKGKHVTSASQSMGKEH